MMRALSGARHLAMKRTLKSMRVLVTGGGVNGLLTARMLAQAGVEVVLLERGQIGQEASWAGGGIVSPLYPWRYPPAVTALARWAQASYPALTRELLAETGIDPELTVSGLLFLDAPDARDARAWAAQQRVACELWSGSALHARWPGLAAEVTDGLFLPEVAQVRNPRLLKALQASLLQMPGVTLREQAEVVRVSGTPQPQLILASGERLQADAIVLTGGAWTQGLLRDLGLTLPIRPIKGQMQLYRLAPGALAPMILRQGHYVIPRRDGLVLCGSTLEDTGFDKSVTGSAHDRLRAAALSLWPALAEAECVAQWAGLRPGSPNGIPYIGEVPGQPGIWVNAGQFRNGLVLAPASAQLLCDQLLGRQPVLDPAPYQLLSGSVG